MVAAIFHGKGGDAFFSINAGAAFTAFTSVRSWTCTVTAALADTTSMGQTLRTNVTGILSGTAVVVCNYDSATFAQIDETDNAAYGDSLELELLRTGLTADKGYAGIIKVESVVIDTSVEAVPTITYNLRFVSTVTGTVTEGGI